MPVRGPHPAKGMDEGLASAVAAGSFQLATAEGPCGSLLAKAPDPTPVAGRAVCRQIPKVGAGCVNAHVRICAGCAISSGTRGRGHSVDGVTWHEYGDGLTGRLLDLHNRVHKRGVPGAPVTAARDTEAGRGNTTAGHRRTGGQDRPEGGGGDHPFADIRAGVPRVQLWVPTRTWSA